MTEFTNNDIDISYINKSTYQILCVPNITSSVNLEKDSYVLVMENVIKNLNKIRDDLFFHLPLTEYCKRLDFPNTKQYKDKTISRTQIQLHLSAFLIT